jgi:hypothetical protein
VSVVRSAPSRRAGERAGALLLLAFSMSSPACSDDEPDCVKLPASCDISELGCQREVFAATACTRGQSGAKMPAIRALTKAQYEAELREEASAEDDYGELAWGRALALFGLIPGDQSFEEASIVQSVNFVAAYYSRDEQNVTIIRNNTMGSAAATLTLSHEFVHALQDQREGLNTFYDAYADSTDSVAALKCLTEGEAVTISNLTMPDLANGDPRQVLWHNYFGSWRARTLEELTEAPSPILSAKSLVYPVGGLGVARAYLGQGLRGIAALYEQPTLTFLGWAKPSERASAASAPDCLPPEPPAGFEQRFYDQQGMLGLLSLYVALGLGPLYHDAQAWAGDSYAVYTPIDEEGEDVAVAWHIRFRDAPAAEAFMDALSEAEHPISRERSGAEVFLRAASTESLLEDWPAETCAGNDKARAAARPKIVVPRSVRRWLDHRRAALDALTHRP